MHLLAIRILDTTLVKVLYVKHLDIHQKSLNKVNLNIQVKTENAMKSSRIYTPRNFIGSCSRPISQNKPSAWFTFTIFAASSINRYMYFKYMFVLIIYWFCSLCATIWILFLLHLMIVFHPNVSFGQLALRLKQFSLVFPNLFCETINQIGSSNGSIS
jgi:hypothetical protein